MKNVYKWFRKRCINKYSAVEVVNGKEVPRLYRRNDLSVWAEEAFNRGEHFFFAKPVDSDNPYGKLELCEPEFEFVLAHPLSQEELNELFGEEAYVSLKDYYMEKK